MREVMITKENFSELRKQAEETLQGRPADGLELSEVPLEETHRLIHELRVHQTELEMQNEELRRAQLELEAARDRYSDLYDFAPVGYFTISEKGMILGANLTGASLLGVERGFLIRKPFSHFITRDTQDVFYLHRNKLLETKAPRICELKLVKKDGTEFYAQLESMFVQDAEGNFNQLRMTVSDINERKRAEEALQRAHDELERRVEERTRELAKVNEELQGEITERKQAEEKLKEYSERLEEMVDERTKELKDAQEKLVRQEKLAVLGQLAGGVGHELRNPLGAIKNAAYFLNMALEKPKPEVKETLEILEKEVGSSERIISSLLDFARPRPPMLRKADCSDVLQDVLSRITVPENIEVVRQLDEALPTILTDPNQLAQVFTNIIVNGIQAMPEGGKLVVKVSANSGEPSEAESPEWVAISFTDTGVGIPQENLERLFEPLFSTKAEGIGFGLTVTRTLVEGHEGTIEVESEVGKGSKFTVRLPSGLMIGD